MDTKSRNVRHFIRQPIEPIHPKAVRRREERHAAVDHLCKLCFSGAARRRAGRGVAHDVRRSVRQSGLGGRRQHAGGAGHGGVQPDDRITVLCAAQRFSAYPSKK